MIAEIGAFAAALALALSLAQGVLGLAASHRDSRAEATAAIARASGALCLLAFGCLVTLFVQSDFSVASVAANSHVDKPLIYKIAGSWGNHEGSMLLWCLVSAEQHGAFVVPPRRLHAALVSGLGGFWRGARVDARRPELWVVVARGRGAG